MTIGRRTSITYKVCTNDLLLIFSFSFKTASDHLKNYN